MVPNPTSLMSQAAQQQAMAQQLAQQQAAQQLAAQQLAQQQAVIVSTTTRASSPMVLYQVFTMLLNLSIL